jgi:hypothetical protein
MYRLSTPFLALLAVCLGLAFPRPTVPQPRPEDAAALFSDVREGSGIKFRHRNGALGEKELIETFASGVAVFDYDNDGLLDIYLVNGASLPSLQKASPDYFNRLYHNEGGLRFSDVTLKAGVEGQGYGMGAATGDYDNDGHVDLYVTNFGRNLLFHNRGNGTFEEVGEKAGVAGGGWSTSAAFFDYDRDGYLDLYVCRYVVYETGRKPQCGETQRGLLSYCIPDVYEPMTHLLYRNNKDGTFKDVSREAGIDKVKGRGLGVTVGDYDGDGWPDLFVTNDRSRNFLFHNKGDGTFEEVALPSGVALSTEGMARAGMGTDFGDYDQDGWVDILVNNFETEGAALFRNLDGHFFEDVGGVVGLNEPSYPYVVFGGRFVDYDNDGRLDVFVVSGHTQDDVDQYKPHVTYPEPKLLFHNVGGRFSLVPDSPHGVLSRLKVSRGAAFGDLDNDGDIDVVVNNTNDFPEILRNDIGTRQNSLLLKLIGTKSNRDGIGTRLEVRCGENVRILEAKSAASYMSANDMRVHVGLGTVRQIDELTLRWPSGRTQSIRNLAAGFLHVISEEKGLVNSVKLQGELPPARTAFDR